MRNDSDKAPSAPKEMVCRQSNGSGRGLNIVILGLAALTIIGLLAIGLIGNFNSWLGGP